MCHTTQSLVIGTFENSNLCKYIAGLKTDRLILEYIKFMVKKLWTEILKHFPNDILPEPDAACNDQMDLMIAFDNGNDHLEFEIMLHMTIEVFYMCRNTDEIWDSVLHGEDMKFSTSLIDKLRKFVL